MSDKITIGRTTTAANNPSTKEPSMTTETAPEATTEATASETPAEGKKAKAEKQSLPGTRGNLIRMAAHDLTIITDKAHPLYDPRIEDALNPDFVKNVEAMGVQVPILVAKIKIGDSMKAVVIDGKQRFRAVTKVNATEGRQGDPLTIPAILVKGDERALYALMVLTNENRRDDTPLAKAQKVQRFMAIYLGEPKDGAHDKGAVTAAKKEAAIVFGVTVKTIEGRTKLLETVPAVQKAVEEGRIGWWAASEFSGLPAEQQETMLEEVISDAAKTGKKPTVEGAKVKAGKGDAPKRERLKLVLESLKEAALAYADAKAAAEGVTEAREALLSVAISFQKATEAAFKESKKAREAAKGE
jgi:ParB family chromosome partitioning protein